MGVATVVAWETDIMGERVSREEWEAEPPWVADLPEEYAAYVRQRHPEEGYPRWQLLGAASVQCMLLGALVRRGAKL